MEIWRDIVGYEGLYQISNTGKVRSLNYRKTKGLTKELKACKDKDGYLVVNLHKDEKKSMYRVHRLVAKAFIPNPLNLPQVNHRDENKTNNNKDNLEWCDGLYNTRYGTGIERRSVKIRCIETNKVFNSSVEIQRVLGINNCHVISCCKGKRKTCGKLHWEYA